MKSDRKHDSANLNKEENRHVFDDSEGNYGNYSA